MIEQFEDRGEMYPVDVCPYCGCGLESIEGKVGVKWCPECKEEIEVD